MKTVRSYTQRARAEATAATRERILRSLLDLVYRRLSVAITLEDIAAGAGVTVQTVLRHFGGRDALFDEAMRLVQEEVVEERRVPTRDPDDALRILLEHYERRGDLVLRLLGQEDIDPRSAAITAPGKHLHRDWVREVFADRLAERPAGDRDEVLDLLVVATDVYAWKLLRRDRGLDRAATHARLSRMVTALLS